MRLLTKLKSVFRKRPEPTSSPLLPGHTFQEFTEETTHNYPPVPTATHHLVQPRGKVVKANKHAEFEPFLKGGGKVVKVMPKSLQRKEQIEELDD